MPNDSFVQTLISGVLEVIHTPKSKRILLTPDELDDLNRDVKKYLTLDKTIKTLENQRADCKKRILEKVSYKIRAIIHLRRKKKIAIYLNRFQYELGELLERVGDDIYETVVDTGAPCRVVVTADQETRPETIAKLRKIIENEFSGTVEPFESTPLETLVRSELLYEACQDPPINLSGVRTPSTSFYVYEIDDKKK